MFNNGPRFIAKPDDLMSKTPLCRVLKTQNGTCEMLARSKSSSLGAGIFVYFTMRGGLPQNAHAPFLKMCGPATIGLETQFNVLD